LREVVQMRNTYFW